jgi:multidrug efflux pump subunit AcrA (membrane-fusion protein)
VKLGQRQGDLVVVEQGLQPGERVVMNGQLAVMPGGKVKVVSDTPAAPAAGQS